MYYFHLKTNILAHFQISSSVSLRNKNILEIEAQLAELKDYMNCGWSILSN